MNEALLLKERALALLDCYEALLTEKQAAIMDAHHRCDLSLSEIAEQENVSRASVSDTLSKSLAKLEEFESKIGLLRKNQEILQNASNWNKRKRSPRKKRPRYTRRPWRN